MAAEEGTRGPEPVEDSTHSDRKTTGDLDKDFTRYEGRFDRLDATVRHSVTCLLVSSGLLLIAMAFILGGNSSAGMPLAVALRVLLPWLGFVISACVFMKISSTLSLWHDMEEQWTLLYPEIRPTPYGHTIREHFTVAVAPGPFTALMAAAFWLTVLGVSLASHYIPRLSTVSRVHLSDFIYLGGLILLFITLGVSLVVLWANLSDEAPEE